MKKNFINLFLALFLGFSASIAANAADYNLRFTAPSNENDEDYDGAIVLKSYTVAQLQVLGSTAGAIAYATDESGGAQPCFFDGTNWRRFTDRVVIS